MCVLFFFSGDPRYFYLCWRLFSSPCWFRGTISRTFNTLRLDHLRGKQQVWCGDLFFGGQSRLKRYVMFRVQTCHTISVSDVNIVIDCVVLLFVEVYLTTFIVGTSGGDFVGEFDGKFVGFGLILNIHLDGQLLVFFSIHFTPQNQQQ